MKVLTPVLVLLLACALIVSGCGKDEPTAPTAGDVEGTAAKAPDMASAFTMDIDLDKTVDALKAEAAKMSVDKLEAVAKKYVDAIAEKQTDLNEVAEKLKALPLAEKMGSEAKELTGEMKTLGEAVKALSERFQVYYDAVKAKGGDMQGLTM